MSIILQNIRNKIAKHEKEIAEHKREIDQYLQSIELITKWTNKYSDVSFFDLLPAEIILMIILPIWMTEMLVFRRTCKRNNEIVTSYVAQELTNNQKVMSFLGLKVHNDCIVHELLGRSQFEYGLVSIRHPNVRQFAALFGISLNGGILLFRTSMNTIICISTDIGVEYYLKSHVDLSSSKYATCVPHNKNDIQNLFKNIATFYVGDNHPIVRFNKIIMHQDNQIIIDKKTPYPYPALTAFGVLWNIFGKKHLMEYSDAYDYAVK